MLSKAKAAAFCAVTLAIWPLDIGHATRLLVMVLLMGAFVNGVQTTMYALAAHVYPTEIRSTGVGTAVAIGRIGNVLAAYAASTAIDRGGSSGYFLMCASFMLVVFVALASIRRHVPSTRP
jgi:AAHS family 4-hydroxybenzoate transporter-like MFS transporter